ncbi:hypothetical protein [Streptomyces xanthochromogenes]
MSEQKVWHQPFRIFSQYCHDTEDLIHITLQGAHRVSKEPEILSILYDPELHITEGSELNPERMAQSERHAEIAKRELKRSFPLLHGHALMGVWGALEALIEDVSVSWMMHAPEVLQGNSMSKVKIPIATFLSLSDADRMRLVVSELQRDIKADLRSGVSRFESLLDCLGLGGEVDGRVRDAIYKAQQIRNVLAHRGGVADKRLVEACPGLGLEIGDKVEIDHLAFGELSLAMQIYAATVKNRCCSADGEKPAIFDSPGFEGALRVAPWRDYLPQQQANTTR